MPDRKDFRYPQPKPNTHDTRDRDFVTKVFAVKYKILLMVLFIIITAAHAAIII
jgi:hypothetical protein